MLAGLEFHPMLSDARRTVLTFQAGTSLVQAPSASNVFVIGRQLRLIGDVSLLHQMGRTWLLTGAFERGTAFVEGLSAPVFTDAISISTNGFVNDRTDLLASLWYSNGVPSLVTTAPTFATTTANVRVRVLLSSRWAFTSEYPVTTSMTSARLHNWRQNWLRAPGGTACEQGSRCGYRSIGPDVESPKNARGLTTCVA